MFDRTIGVDTRTSALAQGTGVATYARTLADCLQLAGFGVELLTAQPALPRLVRWLRAAWPGAAISQPGPGTRTAADVFRIAQVHFDLWGRLRVIDGRRGPDLMHWTYPLPLRFRGRPNLYTVHDLIPLLHPGTGIDPARMRRLLARVVAEADHVVTVSEATRRDLIATLGVPEDRVSSTLQAVDVSGVGAETHGFARGSYWLYVGASAPHKNLPRLLAAWRAGGGGRPLVVAGPSAPPGGAEPGLVRLPWLSRPELLALIRDACALLMPSLAEGFGLPVAEAMALGTPVLTSGRGALAEVAGGAALLVDPEDIASIAAGLRAIDADADLRGDLGARGRTRARAFTPEAYAQRLRPLYEGVLGLGKSGRRL